MSCTKLFISFIVPGKPHNVKFKVYGSSVHISWHPPLFPNGYIEHYEISWRKSITEDASDSASRIIKNRRAREAYMINIFEPMTYYDLKLYARNRVGRGDDYWEKIMMTVSADDSKLYCSISKLKYHQKLKFALSF